MQFTIRAAEQLTKGGSRMGIIQVSVVNGACQYTIIKDTVTCGTNSGLGGDFFSRLPWSIQSSDQVVDVCSKITAYFECLSKMEDGCQDGRSQLDLLGVDLESNKLTYRAICDQKDEFVNAVQCFSQNEHGLQVCMTNYTRDVRKLGMIWAADQNWQKFYQQLCPLQIDGILCAKKEIQGCSTKAKTFNKNLAYALLHGRCKSDVFADISSEFEEKYGSGGEVVTAGFGLVLLSSLLTSWISRL